MNPTGRGKFLLVVEANRLVQLQRIRNIRMHRKKLNVLEDSLAVSSKFVLATATDTNFRKDAVLHILKSSIGVDGQIISRDKVDFFLANKTSEHSQF